MYMKAELRQMSRKQLENLLDPMALTKGRIQGGSAGG